ncbi:Trx7/PDZ domain-containing (seleno)protein [soil metagenome]
MRSILGTFALGTAMALAPLDAETVKDREGAVRGDREKMADDARWIYNDINRGFAEATATGKPLLVVLRCVPCLACLGLDAGILQAGTLAPLLDEFVCVRVINANALDLARFQFDYDLSFSSLFFNGDGTLYARFGSWKHQRDPDEAATAGFGATLRAVLDIHGHFPENRSSLAGKQGRETPFATPLVIPALAGRYGRELDWQGDVVKSCVHCHEIGDALRASYRDGGDAIPRNLIYPMPPPEVLGFGLAADQAATVSGVEEDSAAAAAGLRSGDRLVSLAGQPLASAADVAWVLHHAPEDGSLHALVERGGDPVEVVLALPEGWRMRADISRRVGTWPMRAMAFGGMKLEDLDDAGRARFGSGAERLALVAEHVGQYGAHAAAKKAGFVAGDILTEIDGIGRRM